MKKTIEVVYKSNYNGVDIIENDVDVSEEYSEMEQLVEHAFSECNEDDQFEGDIAEIFEIGRKIGQQHYPNVNFKFTEDKVSTQLTF